MSYQDELRVILNKYPEIKRIRVDREEVIEAHQIAKRPDITTLPNAVLTPFVPPLPILDTGFTITETRLETAPSAGYQPRPTQKKAEDSEVLKATLNALNKK